MQKDPDLERRVVIIGGGPAGLTAAYELTKHGVVPVVVEKGDKVGGLARTENYKGFYFDMGGHRFYTKSKEVQQIWDDILKKEFLRRPRLSRIYFKKRFFHYPIRAFNALMGLGPIEGILIMMSYIWWHFFPYKHDDTFEQYVTNRFGKRLFDTFFKTYTEKVWGIPCSELKAEWAAQRIKGLSLKTALLHMVLKPKKTIKTLVEEFSYPRLGPGMMWQAVKRQVEVGGGVVKMNAEVSKIFRNGQCIESVVILRTGKEEVIQGTHYISSMPVTEFIKKLDPPPPMEILRAAENLHYRDFLTVCLIVDKPELFPDNWIYVHDPSVKVGRIQNFKNWSPDMVPDQSRTSLGLEYFCNEGDEIWNMADANLIELAKQDLSTIGLVCAADIEEGCVFRVPKAYPIYDSDYLGSLTTLKEYVKGLENFQTIGRNGLHRYNNQDHAMLTGILAVRNLVRGEQNDLWNVNAEQEYLEEMPSELTDITPEVTDVLQEAIARAFPKLDRLAMGLSLGAVIGVILFLVTFGMAPQGGNFPSAESKYLQLLSQYFPGYSVTRFGSVLGLVYGFIMGFLGGWGFAFLRNATVFFYMVAVRQSTERKFLRRFSEYF